MKLISSMKYEVIYYFYLCLLLIQINILYIYICLFNIMSSELLLFGKNMFVFIKTINESLLIDLNQ